MSDATIITKADNLLNTSSKSEFLISVCSLADIFEVTLPISKLLQAPSLDLNRAPDAIESTLSIYFTTDITKLKKLRTAERQNCRDNHPGDEVEEYFRRAIYKIIRRYSYNEIWVPKSISSMFWFPQFDTKESSI